LSFANPLPWWALLGIVAASALVAWLAYSRWSIAPARRLALSALRFVTLLALMLFLLRPVVPIAGTNSTQAVVPILVDTSRSMSIEDADAARGNRRIDRARQLVVDRILPALASRFQPDVLAFGETVSRTTPQELSASARKSDLGTALTSLRDRYRGRAVAGVVLISDGGDTSGGAERAADGAVPIFTLGVGAAVPGKDREVLSVTAAEQVLDDSRVDLAVSAVSHGLGTQPIELRLIENGKPIDVRRIAPAGDGVPVREVFQVSPGRGAPTVYTVQIPSERNELVPENNARSVLVQPPARPRRVLLVQGAPGFEHSFLKRAWATDAGLEIDSVVRKGKNEQGADTFYIQAARGRGDSLTSGFPPTREALFLYDAIVLANVEGHQFSTAQLEATRAFVGERGGGLLVLGARSFLRQGLTNTAIEEVVPLDLTERGGGAIPASAMRGANRVALTPAGESHPVMQLAPLIEDTRKRWDALPALASTAPLGGPRPGASVLAVTSGSGGTPRALIAVQRYGEGRAMVFAGEASWRWRMLMPATDRAYDTFWKQAVRWLALGAGDPVQITAEPGGVPGDTLPIRVAVRNAAFETQRDASVVVRVTAPDGRTESLPAALEPAPDGGGRYVAHLHPGVSGVFKVAAEARRGETPLGAATAALLVGGADLEMTDPRLNSELLQRLAAASGGRVLDENRLTGLADLLAASVPSTAFAARRDLWHTGWSFAAILVLLGAEWVLRRRWGLR
jgi:uncharacterized membrane protein